MTALCYAVYNHDLKMVKSLLDAHADPNLEHFFQCTPLHIAAENNHVQIAALLIDNGADIDAKDQVCNTPLHIAAYYTNFDVLKVLIQHGLKQKKSYNSSYTPLFFVISRIKKRCAIEENSQLKSKLTFLSLNEMDEIANEKGNPTVFQRLQVSAAMVKDYWLKTYVYTIDPLQQHTLQTTLINEK